MYKPTNLEYLALFGGEGTITDTCSAVLLSEAETYNLHPNSWETV